MKTRLLDNVSFRGSNSFLHLFSAIIICCALLGSCSIFAAPPTWVGTWATAQMLIKSSDVPSSPGLTNNSLRQVVRVSIGGKTLRLRLSNEFSTSAVTMNSVQIAVSTGGRTINVSTNRELKFNGKSGVTMEAGATVVSDPIEFKLKPRMDLAITIYYGQTSATVTGHPGSRTTSYLLGGNTSINTDFTGAIETEHWYNISAIDVLALSNTACVAVLGNSITDGRGTTTNLQNRWTDILSERLIANKATQHVGVLNLGIGGNNVVRGGLGPTGAARYDRDILSQSGIRWAVVFQGVNDIGAVKTPEDATKTANNLIDAYKLMIVKAHNKKIKIYGATIAPFNGNSYYNQHSESCRNVVNEWIRNSGYYDGVIDFAKSMASPEDATSLVSSFQNDHLHPDAAGYKKMGESVDLNLFK